MTKHKVIRSQGVDDIEELTNLLDDGWTIISAVSAGIGTNAANIYYIEYVLKKADVQDHLS